MKRSCGRGQRVEEDREEMGEEREEKTVGGGERGKVFVKGADGRGHFTTEWDSSRH